MGFSTFSHLSQGKGPIVFTSLALPSTNFLLQVLQLGVCGCVYARASVRVSEHLLREIECARKREGERERGERERRPPGNPESLSLVPAPRIHPARTPARTCACADADACLQRKAALLVASRLRLNGSINRQGRHNGHFVIFLTSPVIGGCPNMQLRMQCSRKRSSARCRAALRARARTRTRTRTRSWSWSWTGALPMSHPD